MRTKKGTRVFCTVLILLATIGLASGFCTGQGEKARVLTLWTGYAERLPVNEAAAADYMAEHPNVKIEISNFELRQAEEKYAISLPAGTAPDLFENGHLWIQRLVTEEWLAPIPDKDVSWLEQNFDDAYLTAVSQKGKYYGIPWVHGFQVLYYNLDHYKEAGLTAAPKTLDELMSHARKLAKTDAQGDLSRAGISLRLSGGGMGVAQKFEIFLYANGGSVMEPAGSGKWKANFANEAGYKALNFYLQALHKHKVDSYKVKHDSEAFVLGVTSQFNRETNVIGMARENAPNMNYGITQVVGGDVQRATNLNSDGWVVPKNSENIETAWDFARFINDDKYLVQMVNVVGWSCSRKGVDYSEAYAKEPHFKQAFDRPKELKLILAPPATSFVEVYTKFSSRLVEAFTDASLLDNRTKIMTMLKDAEKEANDIIKSNGEYAE